EERCSPRANSRESTARATSRTAASTNEKTWNAFRLRLCSGAVRGALTTAFCWYQGRNIVTNSAAEAPPARRWSGVSARQALLSRVMYRSLGLPPGGRTRLAPSGHLIPNEEHGLKAKGP